MVFMLGVVRKFHKISRRVDQMGCIFRILNHRSYIYKCVGGDYSFYGIVFPLL
jgi:hypothetical protein